MEEEFNIVQTQIKRRKTASLDKIPPEVWKTRKFDDLLLWVCNTLYKQITIEKWTKVCILSFTMKSDIGITKNYRGMTLTSIASKVYNALFLNCIKFQNEKILMKNQNSFQRNWSTISQILTIHWIIEGVCAKNLEAALLFVDFSKVFDSIHGKWSKYYKHIVSSKKLWQL